MGSLSEKFAWQLNQWFPPLRMHQGLELAKRSISENQRWAYEEAKRIVFGFDPYWDLHDKHVLDIGTGLGGKIPFYFENGAAKVTGIDIRVDSLQISAQNVKEFLAQSEKQQNQVQFTAADAAEFPFADDSFDAIVSINVFEHIERVDMALKEAYRVLKPGGMAYLHLPPYYSPWGPHLENWVHYPWPHLLFSDKTLINIAAREDAKLQLSENFVQAAQVDWKNAGDVMPNVNKVTIKKFRKYIQQAGFSYIQAIFLPVGYDKFRKSGLINSLLLQMAHAGAKIPGLQEVIVTKMVYVLKKETIE